jgi:hypothetical protein
MAEAIVTLLKSTWISQVMVNERWLWAICETLHFVGLALLIGAAGVLDLRLLGYMRRVSVAAAMQFRWFAAAGLALNFITGSLFFIGAPNQYIVNPSWWAKVFFLIIAMVNIAYFETRHGKRALTIGAGEDTPMGFKVAGAVSILAWSMVLYFGRMLPFIGNAF